MFVWTGLMGQNCSVRRRHVIKQENNCCENVAFKEHIYDGQSTTSPMMTCCVTARFAGMEMTSRVKRIALHE